MKRIFILFSILLISLSSCKRWQHQYPEDTEKSKFTPQERLINKTWELQNVILNGVDYTDSVMDKIGKFQLSFSTSKTEHNDAYYYGGAFSEYEGGISTVYNLYNNEEKIVLIRMSSLSPLNTIVALYLPDEFLKNDGIYILRLEKDIFKIKYTNKTGDSIITCTFISN